MLFSNQFKSSNWPPLFVPNLKNCYLSKMISFLKCPFVPTFLLIIARRCDKKNGNVFSQGPICLGVFLPVCILSLISVNKTESHMWNCIIFYFFYFLKKKKWNEMRWDENKTLCWIMILAWMTWKRSLAFNNDGGKNCTKKQSTNLFTKKNKKIKKLQSSSHPACLLWTLSM